MKNNKEVLDFCHNCVYYIQFNFQRVIDLNHRRDCIFDILSKCDHIDENLHIRVLGVIDDLSLMFMVGNVENLVHETNNLITNITINFFCIITIPLLK